MAYAGYDPDKDIPNLTDKVILLTGGTGGVGKTAVLELAKHSPGHIFFTGRNQAAADAVIAECAPHSAIVTFLSCDLTSLASVRAAAAKFTAERLDVFIANAGIMAVPGAVSTDGYEVQFATNHIGNAALLMHLLPIMQRTVDIPGADVRFVALTSTAYRGHPTGGVSFDSLSTTQEAMVLGSWVRYCQSKLANIVFAKELARRYPKITSLAVHPGTVRTELITKLPFIKRAFVYATNFTLLTPRQGSYNTLWAATAEDVKTKARDKKTAFFMPVGKADAGNATCLDVELGKKLWEWTEKAVGVGTS